MSQRPSVSQYVSNAAPEIFGSALQTVMYKVPWTTATTTSTSYIQNTNFDVSITTKGDNTKFLIYGWLKLSTSYNFGLHKLTATTGAGTVTVLECPAAYGRGPFSNEPGGEFFLWQPNYAAGTVIDFDWYYRAGYGGTSDPTGVSSAVGLSVNDTSSNKWSQNVLVFQELPSSGGVVLLP